MSATDATPPPAPPLPLVAACRQLLKRLKENGLSIRNVVAMPRDEATIRARRLWERVYRPGDELTYTALMYRNIEINMEPATHEADGTLLVLRLRPVQPSWEPAYYKEFRCLAQQLAVEGHQLIVRDKDGRGGAATCFAITHAENDEDLHKALDEINARISLRLEMKNGRRDDVPGTRSGR